jgi:hypothetical protein
LYRADLIKQSAETGYYPKSKSAETRTNLVQLLNGTETRKMRVLCDPSQKDHRGKRTCLCNSRPVSDNGTAFAEYFSLTSDAAKGCDSLLRTVRNLIIEEDDSVRGFNIAVNCGAVAGQTIFHCHIHLIPRRHGETVKPRGGVRHLIPGQGYF